MMTSTFDRKMGCTPILSVKSVSQRRSKVPLTKDGNVGGRCKRSLRQGKTQRRSPLEFSSQCRRGDLLPYDSHDEPSLPTAVNAQICKRTRPADLRLFCWTSFNVLMYLAPLLVNLTNLSQAFILCANFLTEIFLPAEPYLSPVERAGIGPRDGSGFPHVADPLTKTDH